MKNTEKILRDTVSRAGIKIKRDYLSLSLFDNGRKAGLKARPGSDIMSEAEAVFDPYVRRQLKKNAVRMPFLLGVLSAKFFPGKKKQKKQKFGGWEKFLDL